MTVLDAEQLETLRIFAEDPNLTHTAQRRHLSQPAVHLQLARLAESVGSALYRRVGRRLVLTEVGEALARHAVDVRTREAEVLGRLSGEEQSSPAVLAAGEGALLYLLGPALSAFAHEGGRVLVRTRDREGTVAAIKNGEAHLGVTTLDADVPRLVDVPLVTAVPVLAMPRTHRLARRRVLRLADLEGERLVVPPRGRPLREAIAGALGGAGVRWQVAVEATGWAPILHFVALGLGVAVVNGCCALPKGVIGRPIEGLPRARYRIVWAEGLAHPGALRLRALLRARSPISR